MIKKIDSKDTITYQDLGIDGVKVTYSPHFSVIKSEMIKLSKAVLKFDLNTVPTEICKVYFADLQSGNEYIIDEFIADNNKVCIDITDELQDCLFQKQAFSLRISGISVNDILPDTREAALEYYFKKQTIKDQAVHKIDAGKAGSGEINLATGTLKFSFEDVVSNSKVLPISVKHIFNSLDSGTTNQIIPYFDDCKTLPNNNCGKGWKTNFNQYIVKELPTDGTFSDNETSARYTYINSDGDIVLFEDKYYLKDSEGNKNYIESSKVHVNQDGKLEFLDEFGKYQEVFKETVSDSGLSLVTKYENLQGVSLLEQDNEDIASLKADIKSINKSIKEMTLQRENNYKTIELLNLSNELSLKNQKVQENNMLNEEDEFTYQKEVRDLNRTYKEKYREYNKLVDDRSYLFMGTATDYNTKAVYPTTKEYDLKKEFDNISQVIEDKNLELTWGSDNTAINGVMKRKEESIKLQKDIFEMNKQYSSEQINLEIKKLNEQNETLNQSISEYDELILKKTHQLESLQEQSPEIILTDTNGYMMGFSATTEPNVYKLFVLMDNYENQIQLTFNNNNIEKIIDNDKNILKFTYKDGTLSSIEDAKNRVTNYIYDDYLNLTEVHYPSGDVCKYKYDNQSRLVEITNFNGLGYRFEYTGEKISKIEEISFTSKISNNKIEANKTDPSVNDSLIINYNSYDSTSIKNTKTNKVITYVFDSIGRVINEYKNVFENGSVVGNVDATSYERNSDVSTFVIKESSYAENYLANLETEFDTAPTISESYIGEGMQCGEDISAISLPDTREETSITTCNKTSPKLKKVVSGDLIEKIKSNNITDLVLSGWAKADATWVSRKNTDYCGKCEENVSDNDLEQILLDNMDTYKKARRFELRAEITYLNDNVEKKVEQYCSFDWMNTDWQYCAFPVTISENPQDELVSIEVFFDYTNNIGDAKFYGMSLKRGDWEYTEFKDNLKSYSESSNGEYVTYFEYDEKKKLVKSILQKKTGGKKFISTYAYNENGSLTRSIDYNGIVTENLYNDKGTKIKSMTYHKDEPVHKFITTEEVDEKGQKSVQTNEFGEKVSESKFVDKTGLVETIIDTNGNKISYGYDVNSDTLLQMSTTVDDEVNCNTMHYTGGLLTSLIHNNIEIKYEYDGFGKQNKVEIAGNIYCETVYEDIVENQTLEDGEITSVIVGQKTSTTNANNEKFIVYTDIDGNTTKIEFIDKLGLTKTLRENRYDGYGNLVNSKDNDMQNETGYYYDEFGRLIEKTYQENSVKVSLKNTYDKYGNISITTVKIGDVENTYENVYDYSTPEPKHISTKIGNLTETYAYDKLARVSETKLGNLYSKHFSYLQKGDHTSNLIASEWFGKNGEIKDSLKYGYDANGNIIKILENGKEIARYEYDSISRLVREDNAKLGKTTTFQYDCGGNIVRKTVYNYTTASTDSLTGGVVVPYIYPTSGWKDQLVSYNDELIKYDSLGNPTTYRNNNLVWSHGRQLDKFNDIEFKYNANGIRTSKTVNGKKTEFYLDGSKLLAQSDGNILLFHYGNEGIVGFTYQGVGEYYYKKNILGDILAIFDKNGQEIAKYDYDAWGNHKIYVLDNGQFVDISIQTSYTQDGLNNKAIALLNPFRYRGYYYDTETNLYYLNNRYYDPEIGRFINTDDILVLETTKEVFNGLNLYAYCFNNPINTSDENGDMPKWLRWLISGIIAIVIIAAVIVVSVATAGLGTAVAGALGGGVAATIFGSAVGGAVTGAITGAIMSFGISVIKQGISNGYDNINWKQVGINTLIGAASGFVSGAIFGAISGTVKVLNAAKSWAPTGGKSGLKQMSEHYTRHVIKEGQQSIVKNVLNYTKQANQFFAQNSSSGYLLREGVIKIAGAPGGIFNTNGLIRSFWYILKP